MNGPACAAAALLCVPFAVAQEMAPIRTKVVTMLAAVDAARIEATVHSREQNLRVR